MTTTRLILTAFISAVLLLGGCATNNSQRSQNSQTEVHNQSEPPAQGAGAHKHLSNVLRESENEKEEKQKKETNKSSKKEQKHSKKRAKTKPTTNTSPTTIPATTFSSGANDNIELAPAAGPNFSVAGMVGQVNGQAIYADKVFKPINAQLETIAKRESASQFVQQAKDLIKNRLRQIVADNLILGQAMRDLSSQEKDALNHYVQMHRQELIRRYGRGSVAVAQRNIKKEKGHTLEQEVNDYKQSVVVKRYLHFKLVPRINVTRRDIRRYYHNNWKQFHPPTTRTLRIIRVKNKKDAKKIKDGLKAGKQFKKIASNKPNTYNRSGGGSMGKQKGDNILRGELNDAMLKLKSGQWAGPVKMGSDYWFVQVEKMKKAKYQSLEDVQLKIKNFLRDRQFRKLSGEYRQKLFEKGSYNSIEQMTNNLLHIAISKFASGQESEE